MPTRYTPPGISVPDFPSACAIGAHCCSLPKLLEGPIARAMAAMQENAIPSFIRSLLSRRARNRVITHKPVKVAQTRNNSGVTAKAEPWPGTHYFRESSEKRSESKENKNGHSH